MRFHTNRIVTKPVSMEEALEASKNKKPERSLEDILAEIGSRHVKTASAQGKIQKEAEKAEDDEKEEDPSAEAKDACDEEDEKEEGCVASQDETKEATSEEAEVVEVDESEIVELEDDKEAKTKKASKKPVVLKIAKKDDFRQWTAEDIVKAWDNYGSMKACVASTKDRISNPDIWCGLLRVASTEAGKILKAASQNNKKQAKKEEASKESKIAFRKIAKLPKKDLQLLRGYWTRLYGEDYVAAMLDEYAD